VLEPLHHETRLTASTITSDGDINMTTAAAVSSVMTGESHGGNDIASEYFVRSNMDCIERLRGINSLPNEILDQIFSLLDSPSPSDSKLHDEPVFDLPSSPNKDLKSVSLVCQRWRRLVIPSLYKHTCLIINNPAIPRQIMREEPFPLMDFIRRNNLKSVITSFVLCVRTIDIFHSYSTDLEFRNNDFTHFWNMVFETIDPLDIKIVCSPQVLGALTNCYVTSTDTANYDIPYQMMQLRRCAVPPPPEPVLPQPLGPDGREEIAQQRAPLRHSVLFESRPWTTMLFHEGSFIKSYTHPDFHLLSPPSILSDLLGVPDTSLSTAMIPSSIRDFSYIATFPSSNHFHTLTRSLPRLDRLYMQLVARANQLTDRELMDGVEENEMWLERNSCYAYIMRELFSSPPSGNYRYLKEFESGDAADVDAWEMAVEYVKRAGGGWKVERPGVFVQEVEVPKLEGEKASELGIVGIPGHGGYGGDGGAAVEEDAEQELVPSLLSVPTADSDPEHP
jgi:hypothetical protein